MARKKQEIALQTEVETQEKWEEILQKEGLVVIDVYQEWCGPCRAMTSFFRRIKNETGDDLLHFAIAKADTIDSLERYRGKCEPCFLFYGGGSLVAVVRGANPPVIDRTIRKKLDEEHKIIRGDSERVEIRDPALAYLDEEEKGAADEKETEETEVEREVTFALIKPDAVAEGKVDEIMAKLAEAGIEVLYTEERQLTEEEARSFYSHLESEEFFEQYIEFMCSGNSVLLALSKGDEGVCDEFRELLGPKSVEDAKETAPDSLRAQFGSESFKNAIHGADSKDSAARELAFFFPSFTIPRVSKKADQKEGEETSIQRTLALIRPDAYAEFKDGIITKIRESGFKIAMQKEIQLTKEQAEEFYKEHEGQPYFESLTTQMSSGPLLALALARQDAISGWRSMLGPKDVKVARESAPESLRAQFSREDVPINLLHGSSSQEEADNELQYFFPMEQTVVAVKPDAYENRDEIMDKIKEAGFNIAARKETQLTPEMAREFYKDLEDKEYFGDLVDHMTSGNTLFMVLSREDAVQGWRALMGTTDPEKAAEEAPDSLRAVYGKDIKENALHGSSNIDQAHKSMQLIFGEVDFDATGKLVKGPPELMASVEGGAGIEAEEGEEGGETHRSGLLDGGERLVLEAEVAEKAPEEGDEKPSEEAAEGEPPAAEDEAADAEGEAPAAEPEAADAEGEAPTAEGEAADAEGDVPAAEGETAAAEDEATAAEGEASAAEGEATAAEGEEAATGDEAAAAEGEAAVAESEAAVEGEEVATASEEAAAAADETPAATEETEAAPTAEETEAAPADAAEAEVTAEGEESTEAAPPADGEAPAVQAEAEASGEAEAPADDTDETTDGPEEAPTAQEPEEAPEEAPEAQEPEEVPAEAPEAQEPEEVPAEDPEETAEAQEPDDAPAEAPAEATEEAANSQEMTTDEGETEVIPESAMQMDLSLKETSNEEAAEEAPQSDGMEAEVSPAETAGEEAPGSARSVDSSDKSSVKSHASSHSASSKSDDEKEKEEDAAKAEEKKDE